MPGIGRTFKKAFRDIYDYLGLVVAVSFVWLVSTLLPVTIGIELSKRTGSPVWLSIGAVVSFVIAVCMGTGLFYVAHKIVYKDDPVFSDLFIGFKQLFVPSLKLAIIDLLITAVLVVDLGIFFGAFPATRMLSKSPVFFGIGIFFVWITTFWLMMALYHGPLLISSYYLEELEVRRPGTFSVMKRGLLLAAGAPFFTMVFLFAIIAVTILSVLTRFGMAIFVVYPGIIAVILTHATRTLFIRYGVLEERSEVVEDKGWRVDR